MIPDYYHLTKDSDGTDVWSPVKADDVPDENQVEGRCL